MSFSFGEIVVKGAREHNLKNLGLRIPRGKFVVFTGVSGSGKSSLVFDTIYAEGRRQYMESLSVSSRQWLAQVERPDVDFIQGLSPVIAVGQRSGGGGGPRCTVGTVTEVADYARLLWALAGEQFCPRDGRRIVRRSLDECVDAVLGLGEGARVLVLAPVLRGGVGAGVREELGRLRLRGFQRVRVGGVVCGVDEVPALGRGGVDVDLVVDRVVVGGGARGRVADSLELAFREGGGRAVVVGEGVAGDGELRLGLDFACERCGEVFEPLLPRHFSHNHPDGACAECGGLGRVLRFVPELVVPDGGVSVRDGAIKAWRLGSRRIVAGRGALLRQLSAQVPFSLDVPWGELPGEVRELLLHGGGEREFALRGYGKQKVVMGRFEGVLAELEGVARGTSSESLRARLGAFQAASVCGVCGGRRLGARGLAVRLGGMGFGDFMALPVARAVEFAGGFSLGGGAVGVEEARRGLVERLGFLVRTGLGYLTLEREFGSLSGGEAQRVRLATQLGLALVGVTYVLDEPSVGLHPADHRRLLDALLELRDRGNSLLVVEHDEETIRAADEIVEIGPGAGVRGGALVFQGSPGEAVLADGREGRGVSRTGEYLSGRVRVVRRGAGLSPGGRWVVVSDACENNLRHLEARFPVGLLTVVCGVSGSGKSTLVNDVLGNVAARRINGARCVPGRHGGVSGLECFTGFVRVDQEPVGRSGRSTPATFTGVFDELRGLFAGVPLARLRGYGPSRFSFNVRGGRCERCGGEGEIALDMQFLGEARVVCPGCVGARYNRETLEVRYRGLNIAQVLALSVGEAREFFKSHAGLGRRLGVLEEVGLGYVSLGQPVSTLSGGEGQRLKLALELSRRQQGGVLYVLDEPTTGLHWDDVQRLLDLLFRLRDGGNTVVVIEHHRDFVRHADWLLELGPGGGDAGGALIFEGTPVELARRGDTPTGRFL
ncbi:MAG: excinuclease ABC subunit UvrA [Puniceicoccales bacterium]|jgi:excinuclease ABC subunit A|nr:excinuclease ABC subunit UvrA [Puniceicoccales bacterium]